MKPKASMKKRQQLKSLKKRIKRQDSARWEILERAGWKCKECGREYTGRATLVVSSKDNSVLCRKCYAKHTTVKVSGRKVQDKNAVIEDVMEHGNMSKVADKHGVSRERIRQIVTRHLKKEIKEGLEDGSYDNPEGKSIRQLVKQEIRGFSRNRKRKKVYKKLKEARNHGVYPERYTSQSGFAQKVGLSIGELRRYAPDVLNTVRENIPVGMGGKKWSRYYLKCRMCGTTATHHRSHGYCEKCYPQTDHFKAIQEASRLRNSSRWKPNQLRYLKKYYDKKNFGGNREKALERDNYKCTKCSLEASKHQEKYGQRIRVVHLKSTNNHSLSNLATMCLPCSMEYMRSKRSKKNGGSV